MADILIACTRKDEDRIEPIIALLRSRDLAIELKVGEEGTALPSGLVPGLKAAKCVLVVWSSSSSRSPWIKFVTVDGEEREVLVLVHLDATAVRPELTVIPSMDLSASPWGPTAPETKELLDAVEARLGLRSRGSATGATTTRGRRAALRRVLFRARPPWGRGQDIEARSERWIADSPWMAIVVGFAIIFSLTVLWMIGRIVRVKSPAVPPLAMSQPAADQPSRQHTTMPGLRPASPAIEGPKLMRPWREVVRIRPGDTLATVARRHQVSASALAEANQLKDGTLAPGQMLVLPAIDMNEAAQLETNKARTRFIIGLERPVEFQVFSLRGPDRVFVDLPDVRMWLPPAGPAFGLVNSIRGGVSAPGRARIVIHVSGPVVVERAAIEQGMGGKTVHLVLEMSATDRPPSNEPDLSAAIEQSFARELVARWGYRPNKATKHDLPLESGEQDAITAILNDLADREREILQYFMLAEREGRIQSDPISRLIRSDESRPASNFFFRFAQLRHDASVAGALFNMAARYSKNEEVALLMRSGQELAAHLQVLERSAAKLKGKKEYPDAIAQLAENTQRLIEKALQIVRQFPQSARWVRAEPLTLAEAQALLQENEALWTHLSLGEADTDNYVLAVTKNEIRFASVALNAGDLNESIQSLRCGLDGRAWEGAGADRCLRLTGSKAAPPRDGPLPFNAQVAHRIYTALFAPFADLVRGKDLLVVPSGPLASIPLHVLVAEEPQLAMTSEPGEIYGKLAWLAHRHAITVLPSIASLKALREFARPSTASQPYIGFGNPLLVGQSGRDLAAWSALTCAAKASRTASSRGPVDRDWPAHLFRGGLANIEVVRQQDPLPETTAELCAVAESLRAPTTAIYVGPQAREMKVKQLSENGELARYRVIHFATHGLLAGELLGMAESALVLTPPETPSDEDDGLLTASEVAGLKLDADWVILSACNTAAGGALGAEPFSGLARAFFHAGARALVVSHWDLDSTAAVALITRTFAVLAEEAAAGRRIGRAEALRRAMVELIEKGGKLSHPAFWAPFSLVGDGGTISH